jgi:hypothetical protein
VIKSMLIRGVGLLALVTHLHGSSSELTYVDFFAHAPSAFGVSSDGVRTFDVITSASWCVSKDDYICVKSKVFLFSVPRQGTLPHQWSHAGALYTVLSEKQSLFHGELLKLKIIQQKWNKSTHQYLYADEYGVIGIKGESSAIFVMQRCGFAARSDSRNCLKPFENQ